MNLHHLKWYDPDEYTECPYCGEWQLNTYSGICESCGYTIGD